MIRFVKGRDVSHNIEFGYVEFTVSDPTALGATLTSVAGLLPGSDPGEGVWAYRNDDVDRRVFVRGGERNDCSALGFVAVNEEAFEEVTRRLGATGFPLREGTAEEASLRGARQVRVGSTPWGLTFELALDLRPSDTAFSSPLVTGGFQTAGVGVGHTALAVLDFAESERFLLEGLSMVQSDWIEAEIMDGIELEVRFYHCNSRHHSIALAKVPFDLGKVLHHFQVEVNDRDDVGYAFDRAWAAGMEFANGLGVHDNEGAFSFYVTTTAGFLLEVGHGTKKVYDPWDGNRKYDSISRWGHQPLARP